MKAICEEKIKEMVEAYVSQEKLGDVLDMMSRFPQMSVENILLLLWQLPKATVVCGKGAWKDYHASVKSGERAIALFVPVFHIAKHEEKNPTDDFLGDNVSYDVLAVYDISQVDVTEHTPDFVIKQKLPENRIETVLKEHWQVTVIEDITAERVGNNRMIKSRFFEEEKEIYLRAGLSRQVRETELLKYYARLYVNHTGITAYVMELEHYIKLVLGKHFEFSGIDLAIRRTGLFTAALEEKWEVLQQLSVFVFQMISELLGKRQLNFIQTVFCNMFFESENMSKTMNSVEKAGELADTVDLQKELVRFLNWMQQLTREDYKYIRKRRGEQTLFTFPSVVLPEKRTDR